MRESFAALLYRLRQRANLSNSELSELASVPCSLISGLENGHRRVGEYQARKIGTALRLEDKELNEFILSGVDTCTSKILREVRNYPSRVLNISAQQLKRANIDPEDICDYSLEEADRCSRLYLKLANGKTARVETSIFLIT